MYIWVPNIEDIKSGTALVNTLQENKSFFTDGQLQKAKLAKKLLLTMAYPTVDQLKVMVRMNFIEDSPVILATLILLKKFMARMWQPSRERRPILPQLP